VLNRPSIRASFLAAAAVALLAVAPVRAADGPVRFLGFDPIGPLAVERGGVLAKHGDRACRSWGPVGSRWRELDVFGRIAGEVTINRRDFYEYSGCDELSVRRASGHRGAGVFVDARAPYREPLVKSWQPDEDAMRALEAVARAHQEKIRNVIPRLHVPFEKRVLFFEWPATGERHAVVGGRSLIVLVFRQGRWDVVFEEKPPKNRSQDEGYRALVVTDMNGDGRPEIVFHFKEESGEWYGDFTLSLGSDGVWREIGAGIFGSTS